MSSGLIIVGYDGSPVADHAIREAAALLGPRPALVVVVWESGAAYEAHGGDVMLAVPVDLATAGVTDQARYEGAQRLASRGAALAAEVGFDAEGLVAAQDLSVAETLVQLAGERDASALVVGARGHSRLKKFFLGSSSLQVLEHAPCPVVVVGPPER